MRRSSQVQIRRPIKWTARKWTVPRKWTVLTQSGRLFEPSSYMTVHFCTYGSSSLTPRTVHFYPRPFTLHWTKAFDYLYHINYMWSRLSVLALHFGFKNYLLITSVVGAILTLSFPMMIRQSYTLGIISRIILGSLHSGWFPGMIFNFWIRNRRRFNFDFVDAS